MRLYYLCPDYDSHAGGVRVIYRHVDILRRNGYEAFVVHERRGFRETAFENETPVLAWSTRSYARHASLPSRSMRSIRRSTGRLSSDVTTLHLLEPPRFKIERSDVVVIPEVFGPNLGAIAPGIPKVIFAQNGYEVFRGYSADPRSLVPAYRHSDVVAALAISEDTRAVIEYAFPGIRSYRVRWSLNDNYYRFEEDKSKQIAYMPRKGAEDARHVLTTLASRGSLDGFEIRAIESLDEAGVAACLRESLIFLSLGHHEGLPLPPAEAMACGAIVVGYDGFGGREYLRPEFAFPVPVGDCMGLSQTLERILALHEERPAELQDRAKRAAAFVAENYSPAREEQELLAVWDDILQFLERRTPRSDG